MKQLAGQSVLVLGLGETGLSLARWLTAQGAQVCVADSRAAPPGIDILQKEMPQVDVYCGPFRDEALDGIDRIAISPGVALADPFVQRALARGIPVEGDIELFAQQLGVQKTKPKIIAITGSNGKTTVTAMVEYLCRAAGKEAVAAGNISPAVLDVLLARGVKQPEIWVLELSSFQLETTFSLNADAATVLNLSEDHLDRYAGMEEYAAAKARIFSGKGAQILNRDDARSMGMALSGHKLVTFGLTPPGLSVSTEWAGVEHDLNETTGDFGIEHHAGALWLVQGSERLLKADELQVSGLHNVANALAALALCRAIGLPIHKLIGALRTFRGLPHRVEKIAEVNGIIYYDDSKGTNVGATEAALQGLGRPAVVILGGEGKGQDFTPLRAAVADHARAVVLIGCDAPLIEQALSGCGKPVLHARDMEDAVRLATEQAQHGDAVLLSPACASFDMFRNYVQRAEVFVQAVHKLAEARP